MNTGDAQKELAIRAFATADRAKLYELYQAEVKSNNELHNSALRVLQLCAEMQGEIVLWRCMAIAQIVIGVVWLFSAAV